MKKIAAIFPGQGSQTVGMAGEVASRVPAARALFERASVLLGYDLFTLAQNGPAEKLARTIYSQPAIFTANLALYTAAVATSHTAWRSVVSAGHSFGEYCSLVAAGALEFDEALRVVNERAKAMNDAAELAPGAMSAVLALDAGALCEITARVRADGAGRVTLANFNAPGQIVISGDAAAVERAGDLALEAGAKRVVRLNVSGAWHSELMLPARERFAGVVAGAKIALPQFAVISNVDAQTYTTVAAIRQNLISSISDQVRWHETALRIAEYGVELIVEFGASAVLAPLAKRMGAGIPVIHVGDLAGLQKFRDLLTENAACA